jgi:hypothetical protein
MLEKQPWELNKNKENSSLWTSGSRTRPASTCNNPHTNDILTWQQNRVEQKRGWWSPALHTKTRTLVAAIACGASGEIGTRVRNRAEANQTANKIDPVRHCHPRERTPGQQSESSLGAWARGPVREHETIKKSAPNE